MKTFAVVNNKGGVGKTTVTVNLAAALAEEGFKVLIVDMDMQDNVRIWLNAPMPKVSLFDVLVNDENITKTITKVRDNIYLCPSGGEDLGAVPYLLKEKKNPATKLKLALEQVQNMYDYCLIDCSPSRTLLHTVALVASDFILIPVNMEWLSSVGSAQVKKTIADVKEKYNLETDIGLIIPTFVDRRRSKITDEVIDDLKLQYKDKLSPIPIRVNSKLSEAPAYGMTVFELKDQKGIEDFSDLAKEVIKIG